MKLNNIRIFFMSALFTTVVLAAVILFSYPAYALGAENHGFEVYPAKISTTLDGGDSPTGLPAKTVGESVEEKVSFSVLTAYVDSGGSAGADKEENAEDETDDDFGKVIEEDEEDYANEYDSDFLDSGVGTGYPPVEESVYVIRSYLHFIIFGLVPLFVSVAIVYSFCKWFKRTFVDF
ncbi:hypothetical protein [uncultured Bacteroides sp.]|uniref:hypothetical protein n=1 Tax=uncultured Bacteroides sp. TaxID=162156 RepID=UPI0026706C5E|nr:hypothetical protein [uncultured Bacteroides sp.]